MRDNLLKRAVKVVFFPDGATRCIRFGPLGGCRYRVGPITGLSAWYSGPERDLQRVLKAAVRPGMVAVDAGANWGCHTLLMSRLAGEAGRVLACEPFPPAFGDLEWHLAANHCANVTACQAALSDSDGRAAFVPNESAYLGHLDFGGEGEGLDPEGRERMEVTVRTLDSLAAELDLPRLDLVKIDVQGAESRVLAGAEGVAERFHPTLIVELHTPEEDVAVARWLLDHDYRFERLSGPPITDMGQGWPAPGGVWGTLVAKPG